MSDGQGAGTPFTGTSCWPVLPAAPANDAPAGPGAREAGIVLGGGRGSRLGGVDKASLEVDGAPLIDYALAALEGCEPLIVVGPSHLARPGVSVVREDPPLAGPAAAVVAGLAALRDAEAAHVWLLACDLPRAGELVGRLRSALKERPLRQDEDGAIVRDAGGREQWLAGLYKVAPLREAAAALGDPEGAPLRRIVGGLRLRGVVETTGAAVDLDTWEDVDTYKKGLSPRSPTPRRAPDESPRDGEA